MLAKTIKLVCLRPGGVAPPGPLLHLSPKKHGLGNEFLAKENMVAVGSMLLLWPKRTLVAVGYMLLLLPKRTWWL